MDRLINSQIGEVYGNNFGKDFEGVKAADSEQIDV